MHQCPVVEDMGIEKKSLKDKIIMTIGAFIMWPMIYDDPNSELAKGGKWKAIKEALKEIWK